MFSVLGACRKFGFTGTFSLSDARMHHGCTLFAFCMHVHTGFARSVVSACKADLCGLYHAARLVQMPAGAEGMHHIGQAGLPPPCQPPALGHPLLQGSHHAHSYKVSFTVQVEMTFTAGLPNICTAMATGLAH